MLLRQRGRREGIARRNKGNGGARSCGGALSASYAEIVDPFSGGGQEESEIAVQRHSGHPEGWPSPSDSPVFACHFDDRKSMQRERPQGTCSPAGIGR